MNDVPIPRFIAPVFNDDEFASDDDVFMMRCEAMCPLAEYLAGLR